MCYVDTFVMNKHPSIQNVCLFSSFLHQKFRFFKEITNIKHNYVLKLDTNYTTRKVFTVRGYLKPKNLNGMIFTFYNYMLCYVVFLEVSFLSNNSLWFWLLHEQPTKKTKLSDSEKGRRA